MADKREPEKEVRYCPYCDAEILETAFPFCKVCEVVILNCPECREPVPRGKQICPHCGADIRKEAQKE